MSTLAHGVDAYKFLYCRVTVLWFDVYVIKAKQQNYKHYHEENNYYYG